MKHPSNASSNPNPYWRANLSLIIQLLTVWFTVSILGSILFVQVLNQIKIGALPFGFWMAQQGSIYVFVVLIFIYALRMEKIDQTFRNRKGD